jgi:hypothetical protein
MEPILGTDSLHTWVKARPDRDKEHRPALRINGVVHTMGGPECEACDDMMFLDREHTYGTYPRKCECGGTLHVDYAEDWELGAKARVEVCDQCGRWRGFYKP